MIHPDQLRDALRFLVRRIDEQAEDERWAYPAALIRLDEGDIDPAARAIDLRVKPLDGHPADVLDGFVAPPEWMAVGVVTGGWGYPDGGERARVRVIHLVCRNGFEVGGVHKVGEALQLMDEHADGVVPDTLRRVLELPTPPPPEPIDEWFALLWLSRIGAAAATLSWEEAAALHPLSEMGEAFTPNELVVDGPRLAADFDWGVGTTRVLP